MSANQIQTYALLFPNEEWGNAADDADLQPVIAQISPNISFTQNVQSNITTLSTQNADRSGVTNGFLYVPDIDNSDTCYNISKAYVPSNVTRQANLPPTDFTLIAIAPWISVDCTLAYMTAARSDPNRGFIFFIPDNSTNPPEPATSSVWDLLDGGAWKKRNMYPVYAISGHLGQQLLYHSSLYSGNLTSIPYGHQELSSVDPRYYVRLYTEIDTGTLSTLPEFWMLILVILGVLVVILGLTSGGMHLVQRSRRFSLRRRVASGDVNLEALGIKRLTVPENLIEKLPLFIYNDETDWLQHSSSDDKHLSGTVIVVRDRFGDRLTTGPDRNKRDSKTNYKDYGAIMNPDEAIMENSSPQDAIFVHKFLPYSQPTCPICLGDFISGVTEIRELPCGHIFHPECIDTFLNMNSSLCPMCKQSALPIGYCPVEITNAMVHRERSLHKLRPRMGSSDSEANVGLANAWGLVKVFGVRVKTSTFTFRSQDREIDVADDILCRPEPSVLGIETAHGSRPTRKEFVAARIRDLAARQTPIQDPDVIVAREHPKWKQSLTRAFPGFV